MDELGRDPSDELTWLILDVYESLDVHNPKIQVKINENTPDVIFIKMDRRGRRSLQYMIKFRANPFTGSK